jgi:hypothetical protein
MIKACEFPAAAISELTPKTYALFRSLFMQYISEFETVYDLLSYNKSSIPPTTNAKNSGLIWIFNQAIPFDFGEGIYDQVAFTADGGKRKWTTITDYMQEVEMKLEEFYNDLSRTQHFYDAIKKPTKLPRPVKTFQRDWRNNGSSNHNNHSRIKNHIQELDADEISISSKTTTRSTSETNSISADLMQISDEGHRVTACYSMVFKGECKKMKNCQYSHDPKIIKECKVKLLKQLSDHTTA